jgi:hypothetical protein
MENPSLFPDGHGLFQVSTILRAKGVPKMRGENR